MEQNMQSFLMQRQQFQMQLIEVDSALEEIKGRNKVYKIVGNMMVLTASEGISKELGEKKKMLELRISNLEKQEQRLKDKSKSLREEILHSMKEKK